MEGHLFDFQAFPDVKMWFIIIQLKPRFMAMEGHLEKGDPKNVYLPNGGDFNGDLLW